MAIHSQQRMSGAGGGLSRGSSSSSATCHHSSVRQLSCLSLPSWSLISRLVITASTILFSLYYQLFIVDSFVYFDIFSLCCPPTDSELCKYVGNSFLCRSVLQSETVYCLVFVMSPSQVQAAINIRHQPGSGGLQLERARATQITTFVRRRSYCVINWKFFVQFNKSLRIFESSENSTHLWITNIELWKEFIQVQC